MTFEELKKKAAEAAGNFADKSLIFAKKAADKTKAAAKITKLTAEIAAEKESIKKNYTEIGKLYYEQYKDNPAEAVAQPVSEISISMAIIEAKKAEIEDLKKDEPEVEACCCEDDKECCCEEKCECTEEPKDDAE